MKKNDVVTLCSPFTPALTKAFKTHPARLFCQVSEDSVFVTNGQILVKLNAAEYDVLIRPFAQRDPGNWILDERGDPMEGEAMDLANILNNYARKSLHPIDAVPFTINDKAPGRPKKDIELSAYYSPVGDFVAGFDAGYTAILSPGVTCRAASAVSGLVAFAELDGVDQAVGLILPVRLENPRMISSVRGYFSNTDKKPQPKTDGQPVDRLEAVVSSLQALPGISATVKGAQTAAPVVWIDGDAEAHKEELEKLGAKWSCKRSAYYVQIKAA